MLFYAENDDDANAVVLPLTKHADQADNFVLLTVAKASEEPKRQDLPLSSFAHKVNFQQR